MATVTKRRKKSVARQLKSPSKNGKVVAKPAKAAGKAGKMIYYFSKSKTDGNGDMKPLLGGKGRESRRDDAASACRCRRASRSRPKFARITTRTARSFRRRYASDVTNAVAWLEKETGKKFGDHEESAARFGPLRRARFDARHDGHDFESGPERQDRRGARRPPRATAASPGIPIAASCRCMATW